jgi:hypothetical protein
LTTDPPLQSRLRTVACSGNAIGMYGKPSLETYTPSVVHPLWISPLLNESRIRAYCFRKIYPPERKNGEKKKKGASIQRRVTSTATTETRFAYSGVLGTGVLLSKYVCHHTEDKQQHLGESVDGKKLNGEKRGLQLSKPRLARHTLLPYSKLLYT